MFDCTYFSFVVRISQFVVPHEDRKAAVLITKCTNDVYVVTVRENVACFVLWPFGSLCDTSVGLSWKVIINSVCYCC